MEELEVKDIKFKMSRGMSPSGKRYEYNTLLIFQVENNKLEMGVGPKPYLRLKRLCGQELTSLEKVMESSIAETDTKKNLFTFFSHKFIQPKLEILFSEIDKVVIDTILVRLAILGYYLQASIYLINKHVINNFDCGEAAVMAKVANKKIYVLKDILEKRDKFEIEKDKYQRKVIREKEKREELKRRIYG
ncbi:MAG: hypothetical protein ACFFDN_08380 [Candidatus Hodarchaeota archaeon]